MHNTIPQIQSIPGSRPVLLRAPLRAPLLALLATVLIPLIATAQTPPPVGQSEAWGTRGMAGMPFGTRGIFGSVTEVAASHYSVRTEAGEIYIVHFSVNTRIMRQPPGGRAPGQGLPRNGRGREDVPRDDSSLDIERQMPQTLKPSEIKVGDFITAAGEVDSAGKSLGAIVIFQIDPERARQLREMQANYGKTWLAGRVTAINGTRITIEGMVDHAAHAIEVDENTSFRKRRDSITLADLQPGEQLRAEGAIRDGIFLATVVHSIGEFGAGQPPAGSPASPAPSPSPR